MEPRSKNHDKKKKKKSKHQKKKFNHQEHEDVEAAVRSNPPLLIPVDAPPSNSFLHDDIIACHILSRLDAKTLCRLRCVSRSWRALISDPWLIESQYRRSQQKPRLLLISSTCTSFTCETLPLLSAAPTNTNPSAHEVSLPVTKKQAVVAQSQSPGLVCLHNDYYNEFKLCNPVTGELIITPRASTLSHYALRKYKVIIFGYLPSTNEYKIVRVSWKGRCDAIVVRIGGGGSSTVGSWRAVESCPIGRLSATRGAQVNGYFHVMPAEWDHGIPGFHLEREEWEMVQPPWLLPDFDRMADLSRCHIGELGGKLCVRNLTSSTAMDLWLLKDYCEGDWVKQYTIDLSSVIRHVQDRNNPARAFAPLAVEEDGTILMWADGYALLHYDSTTRQFTVAERQKKFTEACIYVEKIMPTLENRSGRFLEQESTLCSNPFNLIGEDYELSL